MNDSLLSDKHYFVLRHLEHCAYHSTGVKANRQVAVDFTHISFLLSSSSLLLINLKAILQPNGNARELSETASIC